VFTAEAGRTDGKAEVDGRWRRKDWVVIDESEVDGNIASGRNSTS
jgi:hypothetical protein